MPITSLAGAGQPVTQTVGNANATIGTGVNVVQLTTALTAPRTFNLPSPSAYAKGATVTFTDFTGLLSATNYATLYAGSATINGSSSLVVSTPYASPILVSDGANKWTLDIRGVARGGTGATTAAGARANLGAAGNTQSYVFQYTTNNAGVATILGISTFSPPTGWVSCTIDLVQGGAGGGSGRRGSTGIRLGGGGGQGGARSIVTVLSALTPAGSWTVAVGKGGDGGAAPATPDTNGNQGGPGGATYVEISGGGAAIADAALSQGGAHRDTGNGGVGGTTAANLANTPAFTVGVTQFSPVVASTGPSSTAAAGSAYASYAGTSGASGGSLDASGFTYGPGTGFAGALTGGAANAAGGGAAPNGTPTGFGTGGSGAGAGTAAGGAGGNGTAGVVKMIFTF